MNLDNLNFTELTKEEMLEIEGGGVFGIQYKIFKAIWNNKETQFVKDLFAGTDAYYM